MNITENYPEKGVRMRKPDARTWTLVAEVLAWAIVGTLAVVLMHVRAPDVPVLAVLVVLFGVAATYLRRISSKPLTAPPKSLEAEAFVLKRGGSVLAKIGSGETDFGPSLALYDLTGTVRAKLALDPLDRMETSLVLYDSLGNQQIALASSELAGGQLNPRVQLFDQRGNARVTVGLAGDGQPRLVLSSAENSGLISERIRMTLENDSPRIDLLDKDQQLRASFELTDNAFARVRLRNSEGKDAVMLTADPYNLSTMLMLTRKNKVRLACRVAEDGDKPIIRLYDLDGNVIWSAP